MSHFSASRVHPGTWWLLGLALAFCASALANVGSLWALMLVTLSLIYWARNQTSWRQSVTFYLLTALAVILVRVAFRVIFNFDSQTDIALDLPSVRLNLGNLGQVELFGRVSWSALNSGLRDGMRLAAVILSIGLANTLANPRKLLKHTPAALYEVATAFVIAINMAPQLISSAGRVRQARELRGRTRRHNMLSGLLIPVLEDTLERSFALAATMDARGFGRTGNLTVLQRKMSRVSSFTSVILLTVGTYVILTTVETFASFSIFAVAIALLVISLRITGSASIRTRYRVQRFGVADFAVAFFSVSLCALVAIGVLR
jgi:energy-coupling factor transport system permease protein